MPPRKWPSQDLNPGDLTVEAALLTAKGTCLWGVTGLNVVFVEGTSFTQAGLSLSGDIAQPV